MEQYGEFGIENIMIDTGWMKYGLCEKRESVYV